MAAVFGWVRYERGRRASAVLLAVVIGLAAGSGMAALAGARRADSALDRLGEVTGQHNVELVPTAQVTGTSEVDAERLAASVAVIDTAAAVPGVESVTHTAFWAITPEPDAECAFGFGVVRSTAAQPLGMVVDGRLSPAADTVVINETAASLFDLRVGSELELRSVAGARTAEWLAGEGCVPPEGPTIPVRVAAVTRAVEEITDASEPSFSVGPAFFDRYAGEVAGCACGVLARVDADRLDEAGAALEALYEPYGFTLVPTESFESRAAGAIGVEVDTLRIAALVAAIAGGLVVVQVIGRHAGAVAVGHPIRRALGMSRLQIAVGTSVSIAPAILVGAVLSVVVAVAASPLFPRGLARRAEPDPGIWLDSAVIAGGFVLTLLICLGVAFVVGWAQAAPSPRHRGARVTAPVVPLPAHIALGVRMVTSPGSDGSRIAAWSSIAGVALAVTGALAVATVGFSADHLRATPTLFGVSADLAVNTEVDDPDVAAARALTATSADPDVEAVASVLRLSLDSSTAHGPSGTEVLVEPEAMRAERGVIGPTIRDGRLPADDGEVVLGRATATDLGVEVGDRVTVMRIDAEEVDFEVVGTAVSYGLDVIDRGFHVTEPGLQRLAVPCDPAGFDDEEACADVGAEAVVARTAHGADPHVVAERLSDAGMVPIPAPSIVDRFREIGPAPWYLAGLLSALAAGALAHASLVTGRRRARELAVARAVGFTPRQAAGTLRWHALTTAAAGLTVGLLAGVAVGRAVWWNLAEGIGAVVATLLPLWVLALVAGTVVLVALATSAWPASRARRSRPAGLLRAE